MLVMVPPPVAPIDSVRLLSCDGPVPRAWLTPPPRPSAASAAAFDEVMLRSEVAPVCSESAPPTTVDELAADDTFTEAGVFGETVVGRDPFEVSPDLVAW